MLICQNLEEALDGVKEIMLDKKFGSAGNEMVIEEFMTGREVSVLSFVDGKTIKTMTSAQDHKRAGDGDTGLNTGGMGTFPPAPSIPGKWMRSVRNIFISLRLTPWQQRGVPLKESFSLA